MDILTRVTLTFPLLLFCACIHPVDAAEQDPARLLPVEIAGWRADGPDENYTADTLHKLINGAAEPFIWLNVRQVVARNYSKAEAPDISVEIFDMGSANDAYGAYHMGHRSGPKAGIGQESELGRGIVSFWIGRYYISVMAHADKAERAILELAGHIAEAVENPGAVPYLIARLPEAARNADRVHYFHNWDMLRQWCSLKGENPLWLGPVTEGVIAFYQIGDNLGSTETALLLIRYPNSRRAQAALARFLRNHIEGEPSVGWGVLESGLYGGGLRHESLVAIVINAPSYKAGRTMLVNTINVPESARPEAASQE